MLSYRQALDRLLAAIDPLSAEPLPLSEAHQRVLATTLRAPYDLPPFAQSLVDGYALRSADTQTASAANPIRLPVTQTLTAGEVLHHSVPPRQALRIMTGASVPRGVDAIIKLEDGEMEAERLVVRQPIPPGKYVQRRGAEVRRGRVVLRAGMRLTPQRIGMALALGIAAAEVIRRPRVAFVAPGDELLSPGSRWRPGKKWCSNLYALALRAQEVGCDSVHLGIVPDTLAALVERLSLGLEEDVVVILGASGRGEHDFTTRALHKIGAEILVHGVAIHPGQSVTIARRQHTLLFGLPGSPWAAFVGFEVLVWPALRALLGQQALPPTRHAILTTALQSRRGVTHFLPARLQSSVEGWQVTPVSTLLALSQTTSQGVGLIMVPPHRHALSQGSRVRVQVLTP